MAKSQIDRLRAAHAAVAQIVLMDHAYLPIFQRLDTELSAAEARAGGDPIAYARALLKAHNLSPSKMDQTSQ